MPNIIGTWTALTQADGMHSFSKIFSSYLQFHGTPNVSEALSTKENGFASRSQTSDLAEATGPVREKEGVAADVWD